MRRLLMLMLIFVAVGTVGPASFAVAGDATPTVSVCASPVVATPSAATPKAVDLTSAIPAASPTACGLPVSEIAVDLVDIAFKPTDVTISVNVPTTVRLHNKGLALHNFSIAALDISVDLAPGASKSIVITATAGEYEYFCNVPGHLQAGMKGTLHGS